MKTVYALYDSRYHAEAAGEDVTAVCYTVENSLHEAKKEKRDSFTDAVIVKEILKSIGKNNYEVIKSVVVG